MGWAIDWLPDGRLLVSGEELMRVEPDGSAVRHSPQGGNELVVDTAGRVYIKGADFDFTGGAAPVPGWIRLIDLDGSIRDVAGDIDFPNGMVITPDGSTLVIAESFAGRLSAFDLAADGSPGAVVRVMDGGEITHRVETDVPCFACALGGPEGRHLFLLCNEFEGVDQLGAVLDRRSARIYVTEVEL